MIHAFLSLLPMVPQASATSGGADPCHLYAASQPAHDWCTASVASTQADHTAMVAACAKSGPWEARCRTMWVERMLPMSGPQARDLLLDSCIETDCTLRVLDTMPDPDVRVQAERCAHRAGTAATYCANHAWVRWAMTKPSAEEIARIASLPSDNRDAMASGVARAIGCWGVGTCPAALEPLCSNNVTTVQRAREQMCREYEITPTTPVHTGWPSP